MRTRRFFSGFLRVSLLIVLALSWSGCAARERTKPLGKLFLEDRDVLVADDELPFLHAWIDPNLPRGYYSKVFFRSVTTDRLPKDAWKASRSTFLISKESYLKEASALADYFKSELRKKAERYPKASFSVVNEPGEATLVFDIAITELEFSHPVTKAGMLLVPVPGASVAFSAVSDPHVAFAARVYDGKSGALIATLGDRKFPPVRVIDVNKLTVTSSTREIVSTWADIIAEGLNRERFVKVHDKGIFRILPW